MVECIQFTKNKLTSVCSSFILVTVWKRMGQWFNLDIEIKEHKYLTLEIPCKTIKMKGSIRVFTLRLINTLFHHFRVQRGYKTQNTMV